MSAPSLAAIDRLMHALFGQIEENWQNDGAVAPVLLCFQTNDAGELDHMAVISLQGLDAVDDAPRQVDALARKIVEEGEFNGTPANLVAFISEAWTVKVPTERLGESKPSAHPERMEVVAVLCYTATERAAFQHVIDRTSHRLIEGRRVEDSAVAVRSTLGDPEPEPIRH